MYLTDSETQITPHIPKRCTHKKLKQHTSVITHLSHKMQSDRPREAHTYPTNANTQNYSSHPQKIHIKSLSNTLKSQNEE